MNRIKTTLLLLGLAAMVPCPSTQAATSSFLLSTNAVISDANPVGWRGQLAVSGLHDPVLDVRVSLNITGGYNGDLYAYVASPQGQVSVLLNRPGISGSNPFGYGDAGLDVVFDSFSPNIHDYGISYSLNSSGQVTGTWGADGRSIDPQSVGMAYDLAPINAGLDLFEGSDGSALNGTWTIFIADCAGGGGSPTLQSVSLQVTTVPEPQSWLLLLSGVAGLLWLRLRGRN